MSSRPPFLDACMDSCNGSGTIRNSRWDHSLKVCGTIQKETGDHFRAVAATTPGQDQSGGGSHGTYRKVPQRRTAVVPRPTENGPRHSDRIVPTTIQAREHLKTEHENSSKSCNPQLSKQSVANVLELPRLPSRPPRPHCMNRAQSVQGRHLDIELEAEPLTSQHKRRHLFARDPLSG